MLFQLLLMIISLLHHEQAFAISHEENANKCEVILRDIGPPSDTKDWCENIKNQSLDESDLPSRPDSDEVLVSVSDKRYRQNKNSQHKYRNELSPKRSGGAFGLSSLLKSYITEKQKEREYHELLQSYLAYKRLFDSNPYLNFPRIMEKISF